LGIALGITSLTGLSATNQSNNLQNNSSVTLTDKSDINQLQGRVGGPVTINEIDATSPEFPGGRQAMMNFLSKNTHYPAACVKDSIQGVVVIQFTVDTTGKVTRAHIVRSVHPELDAEALRVVKSFPAWKPAMQNGKPVASKYTMPVAFRLTK
jgi:TonB family protein